MDTTDWEGHTFQSQNGLILTWTQSTGDFTQNGLILTWPDLLAISIPKWSDFNHLNHLAMLNSILFQSQNGLILTGGQRPPILG